MKEEVKGMFILTTTNGIEKLMSNVKGTVECVPTSRKLQRKSKCVNCGETAKVNSDARLFTYPQNNVVGACLCENCRGTGRLKPYSYENNLHIGKDTKNQYAGITTSLELETIGRSSTMKVTLIKQGFAPTSDCTVTIEYKSPIWHNAHPIGIFANTIQWGNENCEFSTTDPRCGCHTHFGLADNSIDFTQVDYSIFSGYQQVVSDLTRAQRIAFFGRDFGEWAQNHIALSHRSMINNEHAYSIEFRLPKFIDARQYMRVYYAHRDVFAIALKYYRGQIDKQTATESIANQLRLWVDTI